MAFNLIPNIGSWYAGPCGKLMKVKLVLHDETTITKVLSEYLDGIVHVMDIEEWNTMDLDVYHPTSTRETG